jgi:hypothetical protein
MLSKGRLGLLLLLLMSCSSRFVQLSHPQSSRPHVIKVVPNHKYNLDAIFSGEDITVGNRTEKWVRQVTIRSAVTGNEIRFSRPDGPSPSDFGALDIEIWSPDEEFLVLPLDRFHGFCIIRAEETIPLLQKQSCSDMVRATTETGGVLWHQFERWDGNEAFIFSSGLYGDLTRLKYQIPSGKLTSLDSNFSFLRGYNSEGKIEITRAP